MNAEADRLDAMLTWVEQGARLDRARTGDAVFDAEQAIRFHCCEAVRRGFAEADCPFEDGTKAARRWLDLMRALMRDMTRPAKQRRRAGRSAAPGDLKPPSGPVDRAALNGYTPD